MPDELQELKPLDIHIPPTYSEYSDDEITIIKRLRTMTLTESNHIKSSWQLVDIFKAAITSIRIYSLNKDQHREFIPQAALSFRELIDILLYLTTTRNLSPVSYETFMKRIIEQWNCRKHNNLSEPLTLQPKQMKQLDKIFTDYTENNPRRLARAKLAFGICIDSTSRSAISREQLIQDFAHETDQVHKYMNGCLHHRPDTDIELFFEYYDRCKRILLALLEPYAEIRLPSEELSEE